MNISSTAKKRIHLTLEIVISVLIVTSGILFSVACLSIYRSAESQMYTYEKIGEAFAKISVPVYITLGACVLGWILQLLLPKEEKKPLRYRDLKAEKVRLLAKVDTDKLSSEAFAGLEKEKKLQLMLNTVNITLSACLAVIPMFYLLDPSRYMGSASAEVTKEVLSCFLAYIASLSPLAIYSLLYMYFMKKSYERELLLYKAAIKENGVTAKAPTEKKQLSKKAQTAVLWSIRGVIICVAVGFIILGAFNGGIQEVWKKAAEICAECIGLG